jgi:holo-[acyl-carrier protein] synthase
MIIGIGFDLVEVARLGQLLDRYGGRAVNRLFTAHEIEYCLAGRLPAESYAARFAAKEAAFKALGTGWSGGIGWHDVEVTNDTLGAPTLVLHNEAERLARSRGIRRAHVSLTHTRELAGAYVVLEGEAA